ncbi:hypothetical protein GW17_00021447 [Ensete ventricosum]|uniref:Uncharacterized protein n=1 Tax=Ensete ventricosum TaxID=4639 RepID=A0A444EWL3_ENSVE|nr:hypothetical protein GW17_00021447 [Ensete ventricosum]RZR70614.1 hypothetical protein BHM03_00000860 [Ensete ventricosum]
MRLWIEGPKAGKLEVFANLPGFPDNIRITEKGQFWAAIDCCRTRAQEVFSRNPWLRSVYFRLPLRLSFLAGMKMFTMISLFDEEGNVVEVLEDRRGEVMKLVSELVITFEQTGNGGEHLCGMAATGKRALLLTDDLSIPLNAVLPALTGLDLGMDLVAGDHDVRGKLSIESSSVDLVVSVSKAPELVAEKWIEEFSRVLKPGGAIVMQASAEQTGNLIDEDSLLTEEDLKKPQLPQGWPKAICHTAELRQTKLSSMAKPYSSISQLLRPISTDLVNTRSLSPSTRFPIRSHFHRGASPASAAAAASRGNEAPQVNTSYQSSVEAESLFYPAVILALSSTRGRSTHGLRREHRGD